MTFIERAEGVDRVRTLLGTEPVLIPSVAGLETYYISIQRQSLQEAETRLALLHQLPVTWLDRITDDVLRSAGRIKAANRLCLGDAIIAGFAQQADAVLVHKHPEFEALAHVIAQETLPNKAHTRRRSRSNRGWLPH